MSKPKPTLVECIDQLVLGYTTRETVDRIEQRADGRWFGKKARHVVHHPSLLDQLRAATTASTMTADSTFRPSPGSKPAARLDAIATLQRIDIESLQWAQVFGTRTRASLEDRLRSLAPHELSLEKDARGRKLLGAAMSWVAAARVVTGWDSAPYSPNVPCPELTCERRGGLRIRITEDPDERFGSCLECGTHWDADQVPALAQYVRWADEHLKGPRHLVLDDATEQWVTCLECHFEREEMEHRRQLRAEGKRIDVVQHVAG